MNKLGTGRTGSKSSRKNNNRLGNSKKDEIEITLNWVGKHNLVPRLRNWAEENKKEFLRKKEAGEIKVSKSKVIARNGNRYKDGDWEYLGGGNFQ